MTAAAAVANAAWGAINLPAYAAFRVAVDDPERVQRDLLRRYIDRNGDTAFGRRHGFDRIHSPDDFRRRVPIADYDATAPDVDRVAAGELNVLTAEPVVRLATSSGSTRARKLIPYTRGLQREFNRAIGPWIVDLYARDPAIAGGCAYWSISPVVDLGESRRAPNGPPIGFEEDSAYLGGLAARLVDAVMAVPGDVRHVRDLAAHRYVTARLLLVRADLRLISVWHPSFLDLLLDAVRDHWDRLLDDVARGTVTAPSGDLPFARRLRPDPRRAVALRDTDPRDVATIWPQLRLVSCWADGHAAGAAAALSRRLGDAVRVQPKGLLATEAFVTIPFAGGWPLAVRSHFFEFVDDAGSVRSSHQLKTGGEYGVVVTTAGGLWRYRLGDRVRVDGFVGRTPSLRFVARDDHVVDRRGEKLSEGFVAAVLRDLLVGESSGFSILAPEEVDGRCRYVLFLGARDRRASLAQQLDGRLSANPHYRYCRELGQLGPAVVAEVGADAAERLLRAEAERGRRLGDIKASPLSDRTDLRAILRADG